MKSFFLSLLLFSPLSFACRVTPSDSCQMTYTLTSEATQVPVSGERENISALVVRGSSSGYQLGRPYRPEFSVADDDGLVTMTAVFNVLSSNGVFQRNLTEDVVLDTQSLEYLQAAAQQMVRYVESNPDQNILEAGARKLLADLNSLNQSIPKMKKGFLKESLSPILQKINQSQDESPEKYSGFYYYLNAEGEGQSQQQICVNPPSGLRCSPSIIVTNLGSNNCGFKFDSGEVYPTSHCPNGITYSYSNESGGTRDSQRSQGVQRQ